MYLMNSWVMSLPQKVEKNILQSRLIKTQHNYIMKYDVPNEQLGYVITPKSRKEHFIEQINQDTTQLHYEREVTSLNSIIIGAMRNQITKASNER